MQRSSSGSGPGRVPLRSDAEFQGAVSNGAATEGQPKRSLVDKLGADARLGGDALKRMWLYERRALGLRAFDATLGLAQGVAVALMAATLGVCAVLLLVTGLRSAVADLTSHAWWGDVLLAAAFVALGALTVFLYRRHVHRSTLRGARREGQAITSPGVEGTETK